MGFDPLRVHNRARAPPRYPFMADRLGPTSLFPSGSGGQLEVKNR